jgi:hypothetical protein
LYPVAVHLTGKPHRDRVNRTATWKVSPVAIMAVW